MKQNQLETLGRVDIATFKKSDKTPIIVVLDQIRSAHNVGSIFRTCDAFAIQSIYLCGITVTPPNRDIYKTALGSELSVDWKYFPNTIDAIALLKSNNYHIIAIEQTTESKSLSEHLDIAKKPLAIIFGNEVEGVSDAVLAACDAAIEIPQFGTKHSFNVSVTAGIVLWELNKQFQNSR